MKMKKTVIFFLSLFFSIGLTFGEVKEVEGIGVAQGSGASAHSQALQKALRNALERAVGVMIHSESLVKNFQLLEDHIYSKAEGYIKEYTILEDNEGKDNLTRIKVKALVEDKKISDDLEGIRLILEAKGNPQTILLIDEVMDGEPGTIISGDIEQFFSKKGFVMLDSSEFNGNQEMEEKLSIAKQTGADLVLKGSAKTSAGGVREAYGIPVYTYSANFELKAYEADTGKILAVISDNATAMKGSPAEAAKEALLTAWQKGNQIFFETLMEKWRQSVYHSSIIALTISKCPPKKRMEFMKDLKKADGILDINEKNYQNETLNLNLKVDSAYSNNIDEKIVEIFPNLLLTSKTSNRLEFEWVKAGE